MTGTAAPVVVGVDGSSAGQAALAWAVDDAVRRGCAVEAVTGQHRDFGMAVGVVPIDMMIRMLPEELRAARQQVLDKAVAEITTKIEIRTVVAGEEAGERLLRAPRVLSGCGDQRPGGADLRAAVGNRCSHDPRAAAVTGDRHTPAS